MGVTLIDEQHVQKVDWSRYTIDLTVEGSACVNALRLSEVDLAILLRLLSTSTNEGPVTCASKNLQNLRNVFQSMHEHMKRRVA